ncbi:DUF58 domain-containing protein [Cryptosporangium japonicum]|uniref:DUF58 domain-containing protein n=1 Tax=Cryptosporangium japonicum TaxID=80872 RepID=A0ABN0U2T0_9ACTN
MAGAAVASVLAVVLRFPELLLLAAALGVPLVVGVGSMCRRPRIDLTLDVTPAEVSRRDEARLTVEVRNAGRLTTPALTIGLPSRPQAGFGAPVRLAAGESAQRTTDVHPDRRGYVSFGPVEVAQVDALNLVRRSHRPTFREDPVLVRPRRKPVVVPTSGRAGPEDRIEGRVRIDGGVTSASLRPYVPGDDIRRIHWLASARRPDGSLLMREQVVPLEPSVDVLLDTRCPVGSGEEPFEVAVDAAASIVDSAVRARLAHSLRTTGDAESRVRHYVDFLTFVEREPEGSGPDGRLASCIHRFARDRRGTAAGGVLAVLTPHPTGSADETAMRHAARSFETVLLIRFHEDPALPPGLRRVGPCWALDAGSLDAAVRGWNRIITATAGPRR